ncbi:hypothetical protein [uncultured Limnobacter sp.]|uniref:hypothetical protein n=1 Tax=uncultured Limnobacter sp. TaxID=199681 RepID=UPI0032B12AF6|tara:strand:- start:487 stop:1128 length:642 start_codon:yes stop_codon:yes gene_type:complete
MIDIKKIQAAVGAMDQVTVKGGKQYTQVAQRVEAFRVNIGDELGMESELIVDDGKRVVMKAIIKSRDGFVVATGWAEELRGQGVNKMACIENTETSAYGRALANLGIHGGEFASDNEIDKAKRNEKIIDERTAEESTPPPSDDIPLDEDDMWQQWVDAEKQKIEGFNELYQLMGWGKATKAKRDQLTEYNREMIADLKDAYQEKHNQLNTGER